MSQDDDGGRRGVFASRSTMTLVVFLGVGGFYLIAEHSAHLVGLGPLALLLLLCVVMHVFMHRGHKGHGGHGGHGGSDGHEGSDGSSRAPDADPRGDPR